MKLRGRAPRPDKRRRRILSFSAGGAPPPTPHGPLQRSLGSTVALLCKRLATDASSLDVQRARDPLPGGTYQSVWRVTNGIGVSVCVRRAFRHPNRLKFGIETIKVGALFRKLAVVLSHHDALADTEDLNDARPGGFVGCENLSRNGMTFEKDAVRQFEVWSRIWHKMTSAA